MKQNIWIAGAGAALVVGFFLPWFNLGGGFEASGLDIVRQSQIAGLTRLAVLLTPFLGIFMLAAGLAGSKDAATISLGTGAAILGFTTYKIADTFISVSGSGLWLVLAAGAVALVAGLVRKDSKS